jgi:MFS family permease
MQRAYTPTNVFNPQFIVFPWLSKEVGNVRLFWVLVALFATTYLLIPLLVSATAVQGVVDTAEAQGAAQGAAQVAVAASATRQDDPNYLTSDSGITTAVTAAEKAEGQLSWSMWFWLVALISVNKAFVSGAFTTIAILNNNSIAPEWRGRVGGLTMMVASVFKALGPTIGAVLFAWSLTNG